MQYRVEQKYLCTQTDLAVLRSRLKQLLAPDPHALSGNGQGEYLITSLYFDDYFHSGFYENEDGVNNRKKFRLRYYNNDTSHMRLEIKSKVDGYTHKDSCTFCAQDAKRLLSRDPLPFSSTMPPAYGQLFLKTKLDALKPVSIVQYVREPYIYKEGNVRITLDKNICASRHLGSFLTETSHTVPLLPQGQFILEVKYDEFLPTHIYQALGLRSLQQTAFSKYYLSRLHLKETFLHTHDLIHEEICYDF